MQNRNITDFILSNVDLQAWTVLTVDELRRLMTSVMMLVYSMESLLCLTIFKVIMLIIDNKMCCVRIAVLCCCIFFMFLFFTLSIVSSISVLFCQHIIKKYLNFYYYYYYFISERFTWISHSGDHWPSTPYSLFYQAFLTYTACVKYWYCVH